jgi:glycosyltransferase involved in cell wall biosynthesis
MPEISRLKTTGHPAGPGPLVSCLAVVEGRPAFAPWLLWNFAKQDHSSRELVVVDGSPEPMQVDDPRVRVVTVPPRTSVAAKRNVAVREAGGSVVAWFDDDDWQHPRRLSILLRELGAGAKLAGAREGWFVDPVSGRVRHYSTSSGVIFNGLAVLRDEVRDVAFDERKRKSADTPWVRAVVTKVGPKVAVVREVLSLWLCHQVNLSNPVNRYTFPDSLETVRDRVGDDDWADTQEHIDALVSRLTKRP